ncbi:MAG TPA: TIM barrel protein [Candidatus Baltobacteraceae bacterium]|nr:TIM barrel protein [Candidatus Baltobacteraceae bacterium]
MWFADDRQQIPFTRFLDELSRAGYEWLELGPYGYLPRDPLELQEHLEGRGLRVSGGTTSGGLHQRADRWTQIVAVARDIARLTAAVGAHHLIFLPSMYRDVSGEHSEPSVLNAEDTHLLHRHANELGRILLDDYGVRLCLHPHADSHIESQTDIERLLDNTDARYVNLCLDTGHIAYGGGDPVALIARHAERIAYVHMKQIDPRVLVEVRAKQLSFGQAVQRGICVEPPAGIPDAAAVVDALSAVGRQLFVIAEHDLYPCAPDVPMPIAVRTRAYLGACLARVSTRSAAMETANHDR